MTQILKITGCIALISIAAGLFFGRDRQLDAAAVARGKTLFEHQWTVGDPLCADGDGLGPVFNAKSCVACHFQGGVGGSGPRSATVNTFQIIDRERPEQLISGVVHKDATEKDAKETARDVHEQFIDDIGTSSRRLQTISGCSISITQVNPVVFHEVDSPPLFGIAEIESISDWNLFRMNAKRIGSSIAADFRGDFKRNGKGVASMLPDGRVGKLGWKGQFATADEFIATACAMELGLTNPEVAQPLAGQFAADTDAKPDMTQEQLDELVAFVRSLPRPVQVMPDDEQARSRVLRGEAMFDQIRCNDCHVKQLGDVDGIYTDFLLYKLDDKAITQVGGGGYGMGGSQTVAEFDWPRHLPSAGHWQTPPLWGVADSAPYMHDGSAENLATAIDHHHGDASFSRKKFRALPTTDQEAILDFLGSLRAPSQTQPLD